MSVFGRALLAFLVCLPPGTYRGLGTIAERVLGGAHHQSCELSVRHLFITVQANPVPGCPHFPMRGRSWDKLTFTFENEALVETQSSETTANVVPLLDRGPARVFQVSALAAVSSWQAHRTPREMLIATREFLI